MKWMTKCEENENENKTRLLHALKLRKL
jgi:hypothetical protein